MSPRSWSLTTKLIASVVALFIAVTVAIAGATVVTMNHVLEGQVAQQLQGQTRRISDEANGIGSGRGGRGFDECSAPTSNSLPPNSGDGVVRLCVTGDQILTAYSLKERTVSSLDADQVATLTGAGVTGQPRAIDLGGDLGRYLVQANTVRLLATDTSTGSSTVKTVTIYTGLPLAQAREATDQLLKTITMASLCGLFLVGLGGTWLVRRNLLPLKRVAATANKVSAMDLAEGEVALAERVPEADTNTRTEVGQVGYALNSLLDNVGEALNARHQSEMRVRQFVADASHELRTPLASIRGYAEVSRREPAPVPQAVRHALDRIESEAKRMTTLVEDLLLLARLDAGRPLEHQPVDLSLLVLETVGDIQAAGPDHVWRLELPDEAVETVGDRGRLQQVLVNLLANARNYTPAGTSVTTSLRAAGGKAVITVADTGPGISADLLPKLFHRFTRGDTARNRAAGSTGLGLSIVDAVVKAHHGTVSVASEPGSTVFTVTLPLRPTWAEPRDDVSA